MYINAIVIAALVLLYAGLILINRGQAKQISTLNEEIRKLRPIETQDQLIADAHEKIQTLGVVKTVKYLREHKGMSMVDAKRLVDSIKE